MRRAAKRAARWTRAAWVVLLGASLLACGGASGGAQPRSAGPSPAAGRGRVSAGGPARDGAEGPGPGPGRTTDAGPLDADARRPALAAAEERARPHFERGMTLYDAGDLPAALRSFETAYGIVQAAPIAYNIARVRERMAEPEEAARWYRRYLELGGASLSEADRADAEEHIRRAEAETRRRREMLAQLPATSAEMTAEARQFFVRGEELFRRGRYEAALQAFTAAYNFVRIPEIAYNLALASERLGRVDDAILFYRDYLRLRRNAPDRAEVEAHVRELRDNPPPPPPSRRRRGR